MCKSSRGEKKIISFLKNENIQYFSQFKFDECKNKNKLPFDFYLPNHNICIEFQGEQHYHPIPYFGGEDKLKKVKKRDQIKRNFCKNNLIKLIEIPYWDRCCIFKILKENIYYEKT